MVDAAIDADDFTDAALDAEDLTDAAVDARDFTDAAIDAGMDAPSGMCPAPPAPPAASAVIGAGGGTLALGAAARLVVPAGALAADTTITLRPIPLELAHTERALTAVYELGPGNLSFAVPATLTVDLGALPPMPDEVALRLGPASGPFSTAATTRTGTAYAAAVSGATLGFGARTSAPPAATSTCAPTATPDDTFALFQNASNGNNYFTTHALPMGNGFAAIATHQQDALWNVFSHGFTSAGASIGTVNLTGNVIHSIFGGFAAPVGTEILVAYDSNQTQGSEIWVARKSATGTTIGTPVRISEDPTLLSQRPQLVPLPGGGAFVAWIARHPLNPIVYLRAAMLDSSLAVQRRFDVTPTTGITHVPTGIALVGSSAGVGLVWSWSMSNGTTHGVRYQGFSTAGCPLTSVIEVSSGFIVAEEVSAVLTGDDVIIAASGNTALGQPRVARLRVVHLSTGLLGATRVLGDVAMTHAGLARHAGGYQLAGVSGGIVHRWLGPELDARSALTPIAGTSGISRAPSIATSSTGDAAMVTWIEYVNGGSTARGRVRFASCTP